MDPREIRTFAVEKLKEYGLYQKGWRFQFDRAKARFGSCRYRKKTITLSRSLVEMNSQEECEDTVLHEIAHALAGVDAGHGKKWEEMCRLVGARPVRCYDGRSIHRPQPAYWAVCPHCSMKLPFYRMPRAERACGDCCKKYNGGRFDPKYRLIVVDAVTGEKITRQNQTRNRQPRYIGTCPACKTNYPFYRKQNFEKVCARCCKRYANGRYDERFKLEVRKVAAPGS